MHMKKDELAIMKTYKNDNQNLYKSIKTRARARTHTHTQSFDGLLTATAWVGRYLKKHSPTHTHPDHQTSITICSILFVQLKCLTVLLHNLCI